MSSPKLILVTGVSGFLASHVTKALLDAGYAVRGTARGARIEALRASLGTKYPLLEVVQVDDIVTGDLTDALKGVHAVIHVASPLAGRKSPEETLNSAIDGTLNVLRQVNQAGIKKVVLTSSWGTTVTPGSNVLTGTVFTEADWGSVTREQVSSGDQNPMAAYLASKILAEQAAWKFAEETPGFDLATINPPFLYGPYVEGFRPELGTNGLIYTLLKGEQPLPITPLWVDVRDAAQAHVAALGLPPLTLPDGAARNQEFLQQRRFLVSGEGNLTWKKALEYLHETRPELKDKLPAKDVFGDEDPQGDKLARIDVSRAEKVLGLEEWIGWKKCLDDAVDALLKI
ncbi:hypothetical protein AX16_010110 [Volvariella volvacea WC 439]|nr:hypothetical protein AX16_010110 [Volvariella volvacea WC 439]